MGEPITEATLDQWDGFWPDPSTMQARLIAEVRRLRQVVSIQKVMLSIAEDPKEVLRKLADEAKIHVCQGDHEGEKRDDCTLCEVIDQAEAVLG